jgi:hypothetical protein
VPVLGRIDDLPQVINRRDTDIIIIAIPSARSTTTSWTAMTRTACW